MPTNGLRSSGFFLERGTNQSDSLSPLLFIIALKPLAQAIYLDDEIKNISMGGQNNKMLMFADDILILLSNPQNYFPVLPNRINVSQFIGL